MPSSARRKNWASKGSELLKVIHKVNQWRDRMKSRTWDSRPNAFPSALRTPVKQRSFLRRNKSFQTLKTKAVISVYIQEHFVFQRSNACPKPSPQWFSLAQLLTSLKFCFFLWDDGGAAAAADGRQHYHVSATMLSAQVLPNDHLG